ncbi:hypothetical protein BH09GEM1_BH09GEM1_33560 [soil metagenome]
MLFTLLPEALRDAVLAQLGVDVQLGKVTGLRTQTSLYHGTRLQHVQTTHCRTVDPV